MISIQAVLDAIADLELLLRFETLKYRAEIEDFLFTYDRAAEDLKDAYNAELAHELVNYPSYDELMTPSSIRIALCCQRIEWRCSTRSIVLASGDGLESRREH